MDADEQSSEDRQLQQDIHTFFRKHCKNATLLKERGANNNVPVVDDNLTQSMPAKQGVQQASTPLTKQQKTKRRLHSPPHHLLNHQNGNQSPARILTQSVLHNLAQHKTRACLKLHQKLLQRRLQIHPMRHQAPLLLRGPLPMNSRPSLPKTWATPNTRLASMMQLSCHMARPLLCVQRWQPTMVTEQLQP